MPSKFQLCRRKRFFTCVIIILVTFYVIISANLGYYGERHCLTLWNEETKPHMFSPWRYTCNRDEEKARLESFLLRGRRNKSRFKQDRKIEEVNMISKTLTDQIQAIQRMGCDQPNFMCGHQDPCGFGCQLHHRIACLLLSYVTKMPLIHTVDSDDWSYGNKWSEVFLPLGSNCSPGSNTYTWKWGRSKVAVSKCRNVLFDQFHTEIPYPLLFGIPVEPWLYDSLQNATDRIPTPFLWMIGQFTKNVMKLNQTFENLVKQWKKEIGFDAETGIIVGLQIRRTDKIKEAPKSVHQVAEYMAQAEEYFQKVESLGQNSIPRVVYISSDNTSVIDEAKYLYPSWRVMGFNSSFSESLDKREFGLFEIARDVLLLAECEYVVCGFSSNICRLIYEMQTYQKFKKDPPHLKSLDGKYHYALLHHGMAGESMTLWKIGVDEAALSCNMYLHSNLRLS